MLFNSVQYLIFLPIVFGLYFALPHRMRWIWMLLASLFFYGYWKVEFLALMMITTTIDWYCATKIHDSNQNHIKKRYLWFSLVSNLAMLFFFKYFNYFLGDTFIARGMYSLNATAWLVELCRYTIPAGISFYTFQSISYIMDVYRGQVVPERNLIKFTSYIAFFPHLVAGPIQRFSTLYSQLFERHYIVYQNLQNGFRLMLYGFFLKICVADNLASVVDAFYASPAHYNTLSAWLAATSFTFQVYADFFGYSLIAQGSALLFGINLMDNFNKPFLARSIPEFWQRWHISLSTWFRDYLFIPLGGSKVDTFRFSVNIFAVFLASGLWHGANYTMILFGASHGLLYLMDRYLFGRSLLVTSNLRYLLSIKTTFLFLVTLVFFRSGSLTQAVDVYGMLGGKTAGTHMLQAAVYPFVFLLAFVVLDNVFVKGRFDQWLNNYSWFTRWSLYSFMLVSIWMFGGTVNHAFVYFQF